MEKTLHVERELLIEDIPQECIEDCTWPGCDAAPACQHWREVLGLTVDRENAIRCLEGYGAWEREELEASKDEDLAEKVLWLACGAFSEWDGTEDSSSGSDIFVLE